LVAGSRASIRASLITTIEPSPDGAFGDGIVAIADIGARTIVPADVAIHGTVIEHTARVGVAVFGSRLALTGATLSCNPIDIEVESVFRSSPLREGQRGRQRVRLRRARACVRRAVELAGPPARAEARRATPLIARAA